MRYLLRLAVNAITLYLAFYMVDSIVPRRFSVGAVSVAVLLAILLGCLNSFIRPLHKARTRPQRAAMVAFGTLVMNAIVIQVFVWIGPLHAANFLWVLFVAAFVSVLAGVMNYLVGFSPPPLSRRERLQRNMEVTRNAEAGANKPRRKSSRIKLDKRIGRSLEKRRAKNAARKARPRRETSPEDV